MGALLDHLDRRHVFTDIAAATRDDVIREMLDRIVATGAYSESDAVTVLRAVLKRERVGTTGVGRGVAIPHCKTSVVKGPLVAFGRTAAAVDFGATDGEGVRSVFLVVSRPEDADTHVAILRSISRGVRSDYYARVLSNTSDAALLHDLFGEIEGAA